MENLSIFLLNDKGWSRIGGRRHLPTLLGYQLRFSLLCVFFQVIRGHIGLLTQKKKVCIKTEFNSEYLVGHTNIAATPVFNVFFYLSFEDINYRNYWLTIWFLPTLHSYPVFLSWQFLPYEVKIVCFFKRPLKVSKNGSFFFKRSSFISEIFKFCPEKLMTSQMV